MAQNLCLTNVTGQGPVRQVKKRSEANFWEEKMLSTKHILSVGVGIASMAGVMAMSTAPVVAAEGTIEVVTHAGAGERGAFT